MSNYNPYSDYDDYNPTRQGVNPGECTAFSIRDCGITRRLRLEYWARLTVPLVDYTMHGAGQGVSTIMSLSPIIAEQPQGGLRQARYFGTRSRDQASEHSAGTALYLPLPFCF